MKPPSDAELRELLDRQQLYELVTRYCRAIDRVDDELLLSCYHADARQDHGSYKGPIAGLLEHLHGRAMNAEKGPLQHVVANCRFEIEGDVAFGESYVRTVMTGSDGGAQLGFGRYIDRFERRDD
ncbi:MAG: lumazine-binding family protein, partial [Acidimicrobiaceae bacterium]|nr:lumazine-binding family protein [Acidimicrobiaceae bacterium]